MVKDRNPGGGARPIDAGLDIALAEKVEQVDLFGKVHALRDRIFEDPSNVLSAEMELKYGAKLEYQRRASNPQIWSIHITHQDGGTLCSSSFGVQYANGESGEIEAFSKRETVLMGEKPTNKIQSGNESIPEIDQELDQLLEPYPSFINPNEGMMSALDHISDSLFEEDYGREALEKRKAEWEALKEREHEEQVPLLTEVTRLHDKVIFFKSSAYIRKARLKLTTGIEVNYYGGYERCPENWHYEIHLIDPRDQRKAVNFSFGYDGSTRGDHRVGLIFGPSASVHPIIKDYFGNWSPSGSFDTKYPRGLESVPQIEAIIDYVSADSQIKKIGNKPADLDTPEEKPGEEIDLNREIHAFKERIFSDTTFLLSGEIELMNGLKIKYKKNPLNPQSWSIHITSPADGLVVDMEFGIQESASKTGEYIPYCFREEKTTDDRREVFGLSGKQSASLINEDLDRLLEPKDKNKPKYKKGRKLSDSKRALIPDVYRLQDRVRILNSDLDVHKADLFFNSLIEANYYVARGEYEHWGYRFELPNPDGSGSRYFFDFGYDYSLGFRGDIKLSRGAYVKVGTLNRCSGDVIERGRKAIPIVDDLLDNIFSEGNGIPQIPALIRE